MVKGGVPVEFVQHAIISLKGGKGGKATPTPVSSPPMSASRMAASAEKAELNLVEPVDATELFTATGEKVKVRKSESKQTAQPDTAETANPVDVDMDEL